LAYNANWTYTARVADAAGQTGVMATQLVTLSSTVPAAPVITGVGTDATFATVLANDATTADNTLAVRGTGTAGSLVTLYDNTSGQVVRSNVLVNSSGQWSADLTASQLANGKHDFYVTQTSPEGITSVLSNLYGVTVFNNLVTNGSLH
jgi:hypothetical protein